MTTKRQPFTRLRSLVEKPLQRRGLLPVRRSLLPRFLGIGAQKSGTTWLHANLSRHPSIFLPETKELHYFDWSFHRPLGEYLANFRDAGDRIIGEITPGYSMLGPDRIAYIRGLVPDLKVLLLLRDPVERAWSQAVMNLVEIAGRPAEDIEVSMFLDHLAEPRVRGRGDYLGMLDRWEGAFGRTNVHVGFFEDVAERPVELLSGILRFLGAPEGDEAFYAPVGRRVRPGVGTPMPDAVRAVLIERYAEDLRRLHQRLGQPVADWLRRYGLEEAGRP